MHDKVTLKSDSKTASLTFISPSGNWDLRHALEMTYTPGDQWVASVDLNAGGVYEYNYVIINYETKEALEWQNGSNAVLAIIVDDTEVDVFDNW